jgi:hypothetical protein
LVGPVAGHADTTACYGVHTEACIGDITLGEVWKVRTAGGENPPCEEHPDRGGGRRRLRHDVLFDGEAHHGLDGVEELLAGSLLWIDHAIPVVLR